MSKIRLSYQEGKVSPFQVQWIVSGKRYSRFFRNEEDRTAFVEKISPFLAQEKSEYLNVDDMTIREVIIMNRERKNVPVSMIWEFWKKHHKSRTLKSLWDAADEYVRTLKIEKLVSDEHIRHVCRILERLCEPFGETTLDYISKDDLEKWISSIPFSPVTKKNYRAVISAAWSFFIRKDWVEDNVAARLKSVPIVRGEVGILTVEEAERLMRANEKIASQPMTSPYTATSKIQL